jgi:hypothetical protein
MRTLLENAHGMYQVHGVFVIGLPYLLFGVALLALGKAAVCRVPAGPHIAAGERPVRACAS